jgi:hypothetical protein
VSSQLLSVILGPILAGGVRFIVEALDRRREDQSVIVAIASEVDTICHIVRQQNYLLGVSRLQRLVELGTVNEARYLIDIKANYFSVYEALSGKLGRLPPNQVASIVRFYGYCKTIIDGTRPDGIASWQQGQINAVESLRALESGLRGMLLLGDAIVQFTRNQLSHSDIATQIDQ